MRWLSIILIALCLGEASSSRGTIYLSPPEPPWNQDSLPPTFFVMLHFRASRVPPFPHATAELNDPRTWPSEMIVNGMRCALRVETSHGDVTGIPRKSVRDVALEEPLSLSYVPVEYPGHSNVGPSYWYSAYRRLKERSWREPNSDYRIASDYMYYPTGQLFRYSRSRFFKHRSSGVPFEWLKEYYDPEGRLTAAGYVRVEASGAKTLHWYRYGKPVSEREFSVAAGIPTPWGASTILAPGPVGSARSSQPHKARTH
ncbi:MAG: hypothetical protein ACM3PF_04730 [Bacteroidota bacterium]